MRIWASLFVLMLCAVPALAGETVAGRLLVASPRMPANFFSEAVILVLRHDDAGAFGVVVNRPGGTAEAAHAFDHFGRTLDDPTLLARLPLHRGGPVAATFATMLIDVESLAGNAMVAGRFALRSAAPVLADIAKGKGPRRAMLLMGYSGWAPGQLEHEVRRGDWAIVDADEDLVFGADDGAKWKRALARRSRAL